MQPERIGYLGYRLYRWGWQNRLQIQRSPLSHLLLSSFLYYRRGFADATDWLEQYTRGQRII